MELRHSREQAKELKDALDIKQKEYNAKLREYSQRFEQYKEKVKDLEKIKDKYEQLLASNPGIEQNPSTSSRSRHEEEKVEEEIRRLKSELDEERAASQSYQDEAYADKKKNVELELKANQLETQNRELRMGQKDLQLQVEELQLKNKNQLEIEKEIETLNNEEKLDRVYELLMESGISKHKEELLEHVNHLLQNMKEDKASAGNEDPNQDARRRASSLDMSGVRLENIRLKKELREMEEEFLERFRNPEGAELQQLGEREETDSSLIAQQLLKKVLIYEKKNQQLVYEKKELMGAKLQSDAKNAESINIMYSILTEGVS